MARRDVERGDCAEVTQLLDLALTFAIYTANETAYYLIVAASYFAFTDRQKWQVINTAQFLGTNAYFVDCLECAGVDKSPPVFIAFGQSLVRESVQGRVLIDEIMAGYKPMTAPAMDEADQDAALRAV